MLGRRAGLWEQHTGSPSTVPLMGNKIPHKVVQGLCDGVTSTPSSSKHQQTPRCASRLHSKARLGQAQNPTFPPRYPCSLLTSRLIPIS